MFAYSQKIGIRGDETMINIRQGTNDDAYAAFYANSHMESEGKDAGALAIS